MSIPYSFDPLGTLVSGWCAVDMAAFVVSTWAAGELNPLGRPLGKYPENHRCRRSAAAGVLYFGYNSAGTTASVLWSYNSHKCPPRPSESSSAPALELWHLGGAAKMRVTFTCAPAPQKVCCTADAWETWRTLPVTDNGDGTYTVETPPCCALSVHCGAGSFSVTGTITQIEIWK